jgi:hypothetical protein
MPQLQIFFYLQILDLLTTIIGLRLGVSEASPFIRSMISFGPGVAVLLSKGFAVALVLLCLTLNRRALIRRINYGSAALAVWNLCILMGAVGSHRAWF